MSANAIELYVSKWPELIKEDVQASIADLEAVLMEQEQIECPVEHKFSKGVYGRECTLPKGSLVIGKIHRHQTMNVIMSGEVSVLSIDGVMKIKAPHTFVSSPGAKRVVYAHEDTVWATYHGTHETDLAKIEEEFIAKTYEDVVPLEGKTVESIEGEIECLG